MPVGRAVFPSHRDLYRKIVGEDPTLLRNYLDECHCHLLVKVHEDHRIQSWGH